MAVRKPKQGYLMLVKPAKPAVIRSRFKSDRERTLEQTDGVVDLAKLIEFVHSDKYRIGAPGWAGCGTTGINGQPSCFGVTPNMIPGHCGTITQLMAVFATVAEVAAGATRIMLHLGLHAIPASKGQFRSDDLAFASVAPWSQWENQQQEIGRDTLLSFDFTFWGGPKPDDLTLGSPCPEQRDFFIRHGKSGLRAMMEFQRHRRGKHTHDVPVSSNVWLFDCSKRLPPDGLLLKQLIINGLAEIFESSNYSGKVDFSQEGKAPPTQRSSWMGVTNYDALLLALRFRQRWCLDDGHGYPTEPLGANLESAKAHRLPLAAHITYSPSGSDDDLTLGTTGHPRDFLLAASKLQGFSRYSVPGNSNYSDELLLKCRLDALSEITLGCDTFETGIPPEIAMVQDIQAVRMLGISALLAPLNFGLAAQRSGDPMQRALSLAADGIMAQTVDLPNCLAYWRLQHELDPDWAGMVADRFTDRVNK